MNASQHPKRPLVPGFLNNLDQWLLKNYPDIWSARTHLLVYFFLLLYLFMGGSSAIIPDDVRSEPETPYWGVAAGLLGFVGVVIWLIFLFRFNVFKRFGNLVSGDRLRTFMQYYFSFLVITGVVFMPFWVNKFKTEMFFTDDEIVTDVNTMNYCLNVMERDSFRVITVRDTLLLNTASRREMRQLGLYTYEDSVLDRQFPGRLRVYSRRELFDNTSYTDSSRALGNVGFIFYEIADIAFIGHGRADNYSTKTALNKRALYDTIYHHQPKISHSEAFQQFKTILGKYYNPEYNYRYKHSGEYQVNYTEGNYNDDNVYRIQQKYDLFAISSGVGNISERMHPFGYNNAFELMLFVLYFSLAFTLLLFTFRHCTVRTFFFTILVGIVLSIITGILMALLHGSFIGFLIIMLVYYAVFLIISLTIPYSKVRSVIKGVALNFTLWITFTIPVIATTLYYEIAENMYEASHPYSSYSYPIFPDKWFHIGLAQGFGAVILLALIGFYFSKQYRLWYAQPEE